MSIQSRRPVIDQDPPALRLFDPEPARRREILLDIPAPGIYALDIWTGAEWAALATADRPDEAYRHGSTWFAFAAATAEGGER
jgi:hypothetical protein